jgi:hypothetical protein
MISQADLPARVRSIRSVALNAFGERVTGRSALLASTWAVTGLIAVPGIEPGARFAQGAGIRERPLGCGRKCRRSLSVRW